MKNILMLTLGQITREGIVTLIAKSLRDHITLHDKLYKGTANIIKMNLKNKKFNITWIYSQSQNDYDTVPFFNKLFDVRDYQHDENNIIIGDFNTFQDAELDRPPGAKKYYK